MNINLFESYNRHLNESFLEDYFVNKSVVMYRAGPLDTARGLVSFTYSKSVANAYSKRHINGNVNLYLVNVKNPVIVKTYGACNSGPYDSMLTLQAITGKSFEEAEKEIKDFMEKNNVHPINRCI